MALNLPTPGESSRLGPMRVKAPLVPKTFNIKPPKVKGSGAGGGSKAAASPYDQFTLSDPYAPGKIQGLAQQGYATDTANAQKLAAMGYPTAQATAADYAARGAAANAAQQDLAAHIAGIQQATVAQGNTGSAALGAQNAAAAASGGHIAGAPPTPGLPTAGAQAVLGAQTAAGGNYYGSLGAAAYSSGAQAQQRAIDAGAVESASNANAQQRALASLLSGIPSESSRASTMLGENQKIDAANAQTKLSVYQNLVQQQQYAQSLGNKTAIAAADRALKQWTTQQTNQTKTTLGIAADTTKTTVAGINASSRQAVAKTAAAAKLKAAGGKGGTAGTASSRRQALTQAIKIINTTGGTKTTSQSPSGYKATIQASTASGKANPLASPKDVPVDPANLKTWKPPAGFIVINPPTATGSKSTSKTINKPGSYTKYNRAASYLKSNGWSQAEIKAALKQYHP